MKLKDSDMDGIPDSWEKANAMNPAKKNNNGDPDKDGFTDLEEFLNSNLLLKTAYGRIR